jgi:endonuclease-3
MGKSMDKTGLIIDILEYLYPDPPRPLDGESDYQFLVAIALSAQTTDVAVNKVTKQLFSEGVGSTPEEMAKLPVAQIESIISSLGLYKNKAKNVSGMAAMLVEKFKGKVPSECTELTSLPGVGPKTAACFLSQARGVPQFAVDTHVHRLANRWGLSKEKKDPNKVQRDLQALFPEDKWTKLHLSFIYYGREYCRAKHDPVISSCPLCYAFTAAGMREMAEQNMDVKAFLTSSCRPPSSPPPKNLLLYRSRVDEEAVSPQVNKKVLFTKEDGSGGGGGGGGGRIKSEPIEESTDTQASASTSTSASASASSASVKDEQKDERQGHSMNKRKRPRRS